MEVNKKQGNSSARAALCLYRLIVTELDTFFLPSHQPVSRLDLRSIDDALKLQTDEAVLKRGRYTATSSTTPSSC